MDSESQVVERSLSGAVSPALSEAEMLELRERLTFQRELAEQLRSLDLKSEEPVLPLALEESA